MMPMNNPLMIMVQTARSGGDPMTILQQIAGQNPQAAQVMQMVHGKHPQQLREIAENMAKERGVSLNDVARQLGLTIPSDR